MTHTITAIIFDYGNVLLEWEPRHVYRRYFPNDDAGMEAFLQEVDFMAWNALQDKGRTFKEGIEAHSKLFPHYAHLFQAYYDHWADSVSGALWGTVNILQELKQAGYKTYGLTNWSSETFPLARAKYEFFDLLDDMVVSGTVGHVKPEPEIYTLLLEKIGKSAGECLFIDDSLPNIRQAQALGFATVHFQSPEQLRVELQRSGIL